jgi:hypothetical protein
MISSGLLTQKIANDFKIVNPSNSTSGGIILFWKREIVIQQFFSAPNYIDAELLKALKKHGDSLVYMESQSGRINIKPRIF